MRSQLWLLAASGPAVLADWTFGQNLDYRGGEAAYRVPRETRASTHDVANGWTPRPTDGPAVELVRRRQDWGMVKRQTTQNPFVNDKTCGWRAETVSEPFVCSSASSCATNTDRVVACTSSGIDDPFFTVCLDYQAVKAGACETVGPKTGCCMTSSIGECITYVWPGATVKSMYRCYSERSIITMLDKPWTISSSTSSSTSSSSSTTTTTSTSSTSGTAPAQSTTGVVAPPTSGGSSNNTGAIVGGVVGGVAGIALIAGAIAFFIIRSRKKDSNVGAGTAYSAVAPGDPAYPSTPMQPAGYPPSTVSPQMTQAGYFTPGSVGTTLQPNDPYHPSHTPPVPGAYDPRQSYYDPAKIAEQQHAAQVGGYVPYPGPTPPQQQGAYPGAQPPPQQGGYPGAYPPQQQHVSELDTANVPAGHQGNPVEMAASPAAQTQQR